jgi:Phage tail sheath protein subtilisin-like domain/Phage tail sheath C-terminal domain
MAEAITEMVIPSTYIEVRAEGLIGVSGIATGNVGVVGTAARGEIGEPAILSSFAEARETFGDYDPWIDGSQDELTLVRALHQVFANGGSTVYAVRCAAAGAATATADLPKGSTAVVTLTATSPGTWASDVTVQVKEASANGFVEDNRQVVTAAPVQPLHASIADSPRNAVRIIRGGTGQTSRLALATSGSATSGKAVVKPNGDLSFVNADAPKEGDTVSASYEVAATACRDLEIRYRNASVETFTVVDAADIARDVGEHSAFVDVTVGNGQDANVPDVMTDPVPLTGGTNGEAAGGPEYAEALATLDAEPVNIVVLAGRSFTDGQFDLQAHLETAENAGRDRIGVIGADGDSPSIASANADAVANDRLILVAPGIQAQDLSTGGIVSLGPAYAASAVAGLIAALAVHVSPTNKTLSVVGLTTDYNDGEIKLLLTNRVMALERKAGYRVVKGITTDDGPFRQVSVRRIVDYAKAGTRIGSMPYIGRLNNARVRGALQATLNGFLSDMVLNEQLTEFTLTVTATREQEIAGVALVTMLLKPTFSIDYIKVIMNLA